MNEEQRIAVGEVWGIKINPEHPTWFDLCLILGVDETTNNCLALSLMNGRYFTDFTKGDGFPTVLGMEQWERVL